MIKFIKTTFTLLAVSSLILLSGCTVDNAPLPSPTGPINPGIGRTAVTAALSKQTSVQTESPVNSKPIVYKNPDYGFTFTLPADWKGYSIIYGKWEGLATDGDSAGKAAETGPEITIRDPRWTEQVPRQDIPIMIFSLDQWKLLQKEKFHIGAAPIEPSELGRNHKYVFALPARYNFAFPEGYEEVEAILKGNPLKPTKAKK